MKRKLIQQGQGGFTVTLPIKWIRELDLQQGNEVEITQEEDNLVISPEFVKKKKEISIDIEDDYEKNIIFLLSELYRQGYDSIRVNVKEEKLIKIIQKLVEHLFFEMDIIEKKQDYCVIEMISEPSFANYHSILKKLIFIIYDSMDIIANALKTKKYDGLKEIKNLTRKYRKYDNFCRRFVFVNLKGKESIGTISLLIHLLMVQTDLKRLKDHVKNISQSDIDFFNEIIQSYTSLYKAFFNKDIKALNTINKKINTSITEKRSQKQHTTFSCQCLGISRILYSTIVPMIGMSIEIKTTSTD